MTSWLIDVAVRASLILLIGLSVTMAFRRSAAAARHLVWTLAVMAATPQAFLRTPWIP